MAKPLGKVANIVTGNTPSTADSNNYGGNRLFVSPADISEQRYLTKTKTTLSEQGFKKTRPIKVNSILFVCIGSTIGKVAQNKLGCATNQQINSVVPFSEYSNDFIYSFLENNSPTIASMAGRHAVPIINKTDFSSVMISCPSRPEQQKIADCLSSVDELITTQAQKVDALKAHKKGLMQQLFPAEGETVPKLRFPEFQDAGEWEEKKLGELSQILRGGSPRPIDEYITSDVDGLNWLKIADVDKGSKYVTFTKERVLVTALSKTRVVKPGDLIMSNSMSFGRPYILKIESCIHDGWIAVTNIDEGANRDYLYYLILSPTSQEYFVNNAAGSGVQNLNADIIKLLPILIPKYSEQQKIADCLSSFDELLDVQAKKLDALKAHKKGLMQQLFPSPDEVGA